MKISNTRFLKQPPILPTPPLLLEKSKPSFLDKFQKLEPLPFLKGWGGGGGGGGPSMGTLKKRGLQRRKNSVINFEMMKENRLGKMSIKKDEQTLTNFG